MKRLTQDGSARASCLPHVDGGSRRRPRSRAVAAAARPRAETLVAMADAAWYWLQDAARSAEKPTEQVRRWKPPPRSPSSSTRSRREWTTRTSTSIRARCRRSSTAKVFVTDDGAETDLDLGHYERFRRADDRPQQLHHRPDLRAVIQKERRGDYPAAPCR